MSDFIDVHGIAIRNRIAVDGRVTPTVEDWNALLEHIDNQDSEIKALRQQLAEKEILRLKELEGLSASQWISIYDDLPDDDFEVLVMSDDDVKMSVFRAGHCHGDFYFDIEKDEGLIVSHWMPKPESLEVEVK